MARERHARVISVLLLVLTFSAGFMFGLAWDARREVPGIPAAEVADAPQASAAAEEAEADEEPDTVRNRGPVIYEVAMEPEQRAGVDEIITHFRSSMRALEAEARTHYERYDHNRTELLMATQDSIKAILNPDQIAQYDSLLAVRYPPNRDGRGEAGRDRRRGDRSGEGGAR